MITLASLIRLGTRARGGLHHLALQYSNVTSPVYLFNGFFPSLTLWLSLSLSLIFITLYLTERRVSSQDSMPHHRGGGGDDSPLIFSSPLEFVSLGISLTLVISLLYLLLTAGLREMINEADESLGNRGRIGRWGGRRGKRGSRGAKKETKKKKKRSGEHNDEEDEEEAEEEKWRMVDFRPFPSKKEEDLNQLAARWSDFLVRLIRNVFLLRRAPLFHSGRAKEWENPNFHRSRPDIEKSRDRCDEEEREIVEQIDRGVPLSGRQRAIALGGVSFFCFLIPKLFSSLWALLAVICLLWSYKTFRQWRAVS